MGSKIFIQKYYPLVLFLLISTFISFNWFKAGYIYGGGDVGLQTFNPQRTYDNAKYIWWEAVAPGTPIAQGLTALPFQFIFSQLQFLGLTPVAIQMTFFFLILFFMGFGMFTFLSSNFGKHYAILGALFYMFNPYMMVQVWHRFVHSTFFLAASLPFLTLFWIKWIKGEGIKWLLFFLITNLLAVYLYGTIAYILTIWVFLFLISLFEIAFNFKGNIPIRIGIRFFIGFIFWFLTNVWWLAPVFSVGPAVFSEQHSSEESLFTLINIGRQSIIPYSLAFLNPFYLFWQAEFGEIYKNLFVRLIPYISVAFILGGIVYNFRKKGLVLWSFIFLIVLFLAKGAAEPLSYLYILGFKYIFGLGVLRNPFEKIGILLPFVGSILFVSGVIFSREFLSKHLKLMNTNLVIVSLIVLAFAFNLPMLTGQPFGKPTASGFVEVPDSYKKADNWIKHDNTKNENTPARILHLPLALGESISYRWKEGYNGLESSDLLFTSLPSISHGFNIKTIDTSLQSLSNFIQEGNENKIIDTLYDFNVKYIVLHKDVNWQGTDLQNPLLIEDTLNKMAFLNRAQTFGELEIYKISDQYFGQRIDLVKDVDLIFPRQSLTNLAWLQKEGALLTPVKDSDANSLLNMVDRINILPNRVFKFIPVPENIAQSILNKSLSDKQLVEILNSPIKQVEQVLAQNGELGALELGQLIMDSNDLISKVYASSSVQVLNDYKVSVDKIFNRDFQNSRLMLYVNVIDLGQIFQVHSYILNSQNIKPGLANFLKEKLVENNIAPSSSSNMAGEITYFGTQILQAGAYEILLANKNIELDQVLSNVNFIIGDRSKNLKGNREGDFISYGQLEFEKGNIEIGIPTIVSLNLFSGFENLVKNGDVNQLDGQIVSMSSVDNPSYIESPISNPDGNYFKVSFQAKIEKGSGFYFQQIQDTDGKQSNGQIDHQVNQFIQLTPSSDWQPFSFTLPKMRQATNLASVRFTVSQASIQLKDIKLERVYEGSLLLRSSVGRKNNTQSIQVTNLAHSNASLYKGKLNIQGPTFFLFKESFHPDWKLKLSNNQNELIPSKHYIGNLYANAWLLEGDGEYDFTLEFKPQEIFNYGIITAVLSYIVIIVSIIGRRLIRK